MAYRVSPIPILIVMILMVLVVGSVLDSQRQKSLLPVVSASAESTATEILRRCNSQILLKSSKQVCYQKELFTVSLARGHEVAFQVLFDLQEKDKAALSCHLIAHAIGEAAFQKDPQGWTTEVNSINPACTYGAIHGMLEQYASTAKGILEKEVLQSVCAPENGGCFHAVGHIALVFTQGDIPEAIEFCSLFENGKGRSGCLTGVFMENITAVNLFEHGYRKEDNISQETLRNAEALCRSLEDRVAQACWQEIVHAAGTDLRKNTKAFLDFCHTAQTPEAARKCKLHVLNIVVLQRNFDLAPLKEFCKNEEARDPGFEKTCYGYLSRTTLLLVPQETLKVISFCASLKEAFQKECLQGVSLALKSQTQSTLKNLERSCTNLTNELQEYCLQSVQTQ